MLMLALFRSVSIAIPWMLNLAARLLARSLNMSEPLVHNTGVFVLARVQAVENSIGKALCPIRVRRRLQSWWRRLAR